MTHLKTEYTNKFQKNNIPTAPISMNSESGTILLGMSKVMFFSNDDSFLRSTKIALFL